jgi:hypothetical protein
MRFTAWVVDVFSCSCQARAKPAHRYKGGKALEIAFRALIFPDINHTKFIIPAWKVPEGSW